MENIVFLKSTHPSFSLIKEGSTSTPIPPQKVEIQPASEAQNC